MKSAEFTVGGLSWQMEVKQNDRPELVEIRLHLNTRVHRWSHIWICRVIRCLETATSSTAIKQYEREGDWKQGEFAVIWMSRTEMEKLNRITFEVNINFIEIVDNNERAILYRPRRLDFGKQEEYTYDWHVDGELMQLMHRADWHASFESDMFFDLWKLRLEANHKKEVELSLKQCTFCADVHQNMRVDIQWRLSCVELGIVEKGDFSMPAFRTSRVQITKQIDDFRKHDAITISITIASKIQSIVMKWERWIAAQRMYRR